MNDLTTDRVALRYLVEAYARGCDARDADLLASLFTHGATLTVNWTTRSPTTMHMPADIGRIPSGLANYERTLHFVGNHWADIDGDSATGETYCFAHHIKEGNDHVMAIRYQDRYRARGGRLEDRRADPRHRLDPGLRSLTDCVAQRREIRRRTVVQVMRRVVEDVNGTDLWGLAGRRDRRGACCRRRSRTSVRLSTKRAWRRRSRPGRW